MFSSGDYRSMINGKHTTGGDSTSMEDFNPLWISEFQEDECVRGLGADHGVVRYISLSLGQSPLLRLQ